MIEDITRGPDEPLISAAAAARKLGVDVDTLVRWHNHNRGPAATSWNSSRGLVYRSRDIEAWQDRIANLPA